MVKTNSSKLWLRRAEADPYIKLRHKQGYRSRAAYKLIEVDNKFHFLDKAKHIVELGSAPGSWTQVIAQRCIGKCISVDLIYIPPVHSPNVEIKYLTGDFTSTEIFNQIISETDGKMVDLLLSDMAPNTTGIKEVDHGRIHDLCEKSILLADKVLKKNGSFFFKYFSGVGEQKLKDLLKTKFEKVHPLKPESSRDHSSELYFYCERKL